MHFLISLVFIPLNLLYGATIVWIVRWLLFNKEQKFFFKKRNILTPGVIPKYKVKGMNKLRDAVKGYLEQVEDFESHQGYIYEWEKKSYNRVWEFMGRFDNKRYLPSGVIAWIKDAVAFIAKDLFSRFLRTFIPYMYEYYEVTSKIDLLDKKIDVAIIESYYNQYVHKYFMYVMLAGYLLIGLYNQTIFLIFG
ncbi:MAG: hypothetical protein B6226_01435 [Candidatus Cloacimonetes bacterium 4572_65]|nr:MAG: hypothetical protein B6226_01435 [Candidatus Cloacimonetes bacterium 4572_65]